MKISDFIKPELEYLREQCNFVGIETEVFELRSKGVPLELIAEEVNLTIDGVKKISRKINNKIARTIHL